MAVAIIRLATVFLAILACMPRAWPGTLTVTSPSIYHTSNDQLTGGWDYIDKKDSHIAMGLKLSHPESCRVTKIDYSAKGMFAHGLGVDDTEFLNTSSTEIGPVTAAGDWGGYSGLTVWGQFRAFNNRGYSQIIYKVGVVYVKAVIACDGSGADLTYDVGASAYNVYNSAGTTIGTLYNQRPKLVTQGGTSSVNYDEKFEMPDINAGAGWASKDVHMSAPTGSGRLRLTAGGKSTEWTASQYPDFYWDDGKMHFCMEKNKIWVKADPGFSGHYDTTLHLELDIP